MNIEYIRARALANKPATVENIDIFPVSIDKIIDIGYDQYTQHLSVLSIKKEQLIHPERLNDVPPEIQAYDIIFELYKENELYHQFNESLSFFLGTNNITYANGLYIDDELISYQSFNKIKDILFIQNGINEKEFNEDFNPKSERVKKLKKRQLEIRKKISDLKKDANTDSNEITFSDLISIVSSNANGINIFNVFDLNIYQFNDQFNRMKMISDYDISIQSILHGADPTKIELKHWISGSGQSN